MAIPVNGLAEGTREMSQTNITKDAESTASVSRSGRSWRARVALGCALVATAGVTAIGGAGVASASTGPTARLSFSPATISAGTQPDMKFTSQDVPSGSLLFLQESKVGGQKWTTVAKTTDTEGTATIGAPSQGVYKFRIIVADQGTQLAVSAPATLTVTAAGGAPAPAPTATAAPSGSGVSWLKIIVKPVWEAIAWTALAWIFGLL